MDQVDERDRRQLAFTRKLYIVWAALGVAVAMAICFMVASGVASRAPRPLKVADLGDLAPNSVTLEYVNAEFVDPVTNKELATLPLQLVRDAADGIVIFFARSTHPVHGALIPRQCVVEWNATAPTPRFEEPCGGSKWTREGKYLEGPAPRDLDRFPVQLANGEVKIELQLIRGEPHP